MQSPVAKEGIPFIAIFILVALLGSWLFPHPLVMAPLWVLALWCIWFFRDPDRESDAAAHAVIAPADGVIVAIREVEQAPLSGEPARLVSIFMNVFNVHVNRAPVAGKVTKLAYHPGKFVNAALDKASTENERMELLMETPNGTKLPFVQVAGLVARRIVCRVGEGAELERGERFGLIRFGSRVDVYLPLDAKVEVNLGEKTVAGSSAIAHLES
uniref:Phosphatidylserine decarboxylase proenzyme n=1 Tax=Magnetococcus massalia (strain MO-1) TaxID=451514 RepID=A0A1S7LCL8_MAGMO|nr:phosphatidylserine decarboxylase [Candidatus Magnetococcus massalia]